MKRRKKAIYHVFAQMSMMFLAIFMLFGTVSQNIYAQAATTTKIMPLGDSITDCDFWRTMLFNKLDENGFNVESVGSQYGHHEGHSGMLVTQLAATNNLEKWLDASNPDIVMMHFGTNDCWGNTGTQKILDAYTKLVAQMRANNPNMIIVVAQIIPMHPSDQYDYKTIIEDLNAAMVDWANKLTTAESPIILCDQYTGFNADTDTYDGAHPNASGSKKMCENWYQTLGSILNGTVVTPQEPEDSTEDPVEKEDPVTQAALVLEPSISAWGTGYTVTMTLKNISKEAVTDWRLILNKDDFNISNIWCAEVTESGDKLIIKPMSWNSTIAPGSSITFGLQGVGTVTSDFEYTIQ